MYNRMETIECWETSNTLRRKQRNAIRNRAALARKSRAWDQRSVDEVISWAWSKRWMWLVVLAKLVATLGTVVEDGCTFVGGTELECVEVHLIVATARALFLDGGFLWLLFVTECSGCVDELSLLTQC